MSLNSRKEIFAGFSPKDFDKFDCVKLSKGVYITLIYILRGYVVWLMSVTNMKDRVGIIEWIYPETSMFLLSLGSGALGLFVLLILSLRRPNAASWVKTSWRNLVYLLIAALIFDLAINAVAYFAYQYISISWLVIQVSISLILIGYLLTNKRVKLNVQEFPEELPEK